MQAVPAVFQQALLLGLVLAAAGRAEIIDRVAVTVDNDLITESQVRDEIRVAAFLDAKQPDLSPTAKRAAADRLVDQLLMRREMQFTRFAQPTLEDIGSELKQIRDRYPGEPAYVAALNEYQITQAQVADALLRQVALLRFIDLRFKPEVQVTEPDLMEYYEKTCLPAYRKTHPGADPTSDEARAECDERFTNERVDARVEAWLKDARSRARIHYEEDAFQ